MGAFSVAQRQIGGYNESRKKQNMQQYIYAEVDAIMYDNGKIYLGLSGEERVELPLSMCNRHGLIAGATGTGKTVTMKVLAESFSDAGVPVFLCDVKGDVAGICAPGTDSEDMRERIERVVPAGAMEELFYPQFLTEIKVHGEWVNTTKPLFPGYLICDTADPRTVQQYLLRMDDFARVLAQDGQFVPLAKEEVQLIGSFTHRGDRVVPMSEALKDGDQVVVTAGPLLGHEGLIKTINRRKSTAYLELDLCGRRVTTRVGLAVLSNEQRVMRNLKKAIV